MLLTEEEAKTKWCPFPRASVPNCSGSRCMAWQWGDPPRETMRLYHDNPVIGSFRMTSLGERRYPDGWQYEHTDTDQDGRKFDLLHRIAADDAPRHGYCGLAGKAVA